MKFRILTALILALALGACKSARKAEEPTEIETTSTSTPDDNTLGDSDNGKAMGLKTIHFPYDSFAIDGESKSDVKHNAQILKDKSGVRVQVEGHCDQRGGIQYNIALGEKRANAIRQALIEQGVAEDRITTISYGKERLIDSGSSEAAYSKNRRANFAVTSR